MQSAALFQSVAHAVRKEGCDRGVGEVGQEDKRGWWLGTPCLAACEHGHDDEDSMVMRRFEEVGWSCTVLEGDGLPVVR